MTYRTGDIGMPAAVDWKLVAEGRARPGRRRMAGRTSGWESGCRVIGIGDARVLLLVAGIACWRGPLEDSRDVAVGARHRRVRPGQGESARAVVERGRPESRGRMTDCAVLREPSRHMVRIGRSLIAAQVARGACRSQSGVLAAGMALNARQAGVRARDRESCGGMIVLAAQPGVCGMAQGAILGEAGSRMIRIRSPVVGCQMACGTGSRRAGKSSRLVAEDALHARMSARQQESRGVMVECRACPPHRRMANRAILRKSGGRMIRIGCAVEFRQVARHAGFGSAGIGAVGMALQARGGRMGSRQREPGCAVIVSRALPLSGIVALGAGLAEACARVIRVRRAVEVGQVARDTWSRRPAVHPVRMAPLTRGGQMSPGQCKLRRAMIEHGSLPLDGRMANRAILWESGGRMIRVGCAVEIRQVARYAGCGSTGVGSVGMAPQARGGRMGSRQRELRRAMVEGRALPLSGIVALCAGLAETCGRVIRVRCAVEVGQVARDTWSRRPAVHPVRVAPQTRGGGVSPSECKLCRAVIERSPLPLDGIMADRAVLAEARGDVIGSGRLFEVVQMTRRTGR